MLQGYDLKLDAEIVRYVGERIANDLPTPRGREALCQVPIFVSLGVRSNLYAHAGETVLAAALTPRAEERVALADRRILVFLKLAM